jgi:hypothetical protein
MLVSRTIDRTHKLIRRSIPSVGAMLLTVAAPANATASAKTAIRNEAILIAQSYCLSKQHSSYHLEKSTGKVAGTVEMGAQVVLVLETNSSQPTTMRRFDLSRRAGMDWSALVDRQVLIAQMVCDASHIKVLPDRRTTP